MPRRKTRPRSAGMSQHDIEVLRNAIREGFPWLLHTADKTRRVTGLTIRQNIVLTYVTGILAGAGVFLSGEDHPSKETVAAVKAELKNEIAEAEARYKSIFIGQRHSDFRHVVPGVPSRSEF